MKCAVGAGQDHQGVGGVTESEVSTETRRADLGDRNKRRALPTPRDPPMILSWTRLGK